MDPHHPGADRLVVLAHEPGFRLDVGVEAGDVAGFQPVGDAQPVPLHADVVIGKLRSEGD
jgi:hypothetical protein